MNTKTGLIVIGIPLVAMIASAFLLTAVFGPSDNGLRCSRTSERAECEVLQTRFFGLIGNSSFAIAESEIRDVKAFCPKVGGRGGASCNVYLVLNSGQEYPVLSYALSVQAAASAKKLDDYFQDRSARCIEMREDLMTPVLLSGGVPVLFVALIFVLRKLRFRATPPVVQELTHS